MSASTNQYLNDSTLAGLPSVDGTRLRTTGQTDSYDQSPNYTSQSYSGLNDPSTINNAQASTDRTIDHTANRANNGINAAANALHQGTDQAAMAGEDVRLGANDMAGQASRAAGNVQDSAARGVNNVANTASNAADSASRGANNVANSAAQTANNAADSASRTANQAANTLHQRKASVTAKVNDLAGQAAQQAGKAAAVGQELAGQVKEHPLVQQAGANVQHGVNVLDDQLSQYPFLNDIEARTGISKAYAAIGIISVFGLIITFNIFSLAKPATNLIGWVLPAYMSIGALEKGNLSGDKQWLTYWVVFGFINFLESVALRPVLYYFKYYFLAKLAFTVWLMAPSTRGAEKVYYTVIRPTFRNLQANVLSPTTSTSSRYGTTSANDNSSVFVPDNNASPYGTTTTTVTTETSTTPVSTGFSSSRMNDMSNNPFIGNHAGVAQGGEPGVLGGGSLII